jgi:hypothetical protein
VLTTGAQEGGGGQEDQASLQRQLWGMSAAQWWVWQVEHMLAKWAWAVSVACGRARPCCVLMDAQGNEDKDSTSGVPR